MTECILCAGSWLGISLFTLMTTLRDICCPRPRPASPAGDLPLAPPTAPPTLLHPVLCPPKASLPLSSGRVRAVESPDWGPPGLAVSLDQRHPPPKAASLHGSLLPTPAPGLASRPFGTGDAFMSPR